MVVYQILQRLTDEEHSISTGEIRDELAMNYDIEAERKSIISDLKELQNLFDYELDNDGLREHVDFGYEVVEDEEYINGQSKKWYLNRPYTIDQLKLMIECINANKSISESDAKELRDIVYRMTSEKQMEYLESNSQVVGRLNINKGFVYSISVINEAIKNNKKIHFFYLKRDWNDKTKSIRRNNGLKHIVSPYYITINDGFYYVVCVSEHNTITNYRIDRMESVKIFEEEDRTGKELIDELGDINNYVLTSFNMFGGEKKEVKIWFSDRMLDAIIERFGTKKNTKYEKQDDGFIITTNVWVSEKFFAWLIGFGENAKLLEPKEEIKKLKAFINKINSNY